MSTFNEQLSTPNPALLEKVIFLMGPTACGKSDIAIELAQTGRYEIISVDSAMIYRGMDIGTAKPSIQIREKTPHHLVDICDPKEPYSVGAFCRDALSLIKNIIQRGKTPLLVGGTMLYFHQLEQGLSELPATKPEIRAAVLNEAKQVGWELTHEKLKTIDPKMAKQLHPNDSQRIARALEIHMQTGKTLTQWQAEQTTADHPYHFEHYVLAPKERSIIHQRIEKRFDQMLENGFVDEVRSLYDRGDLQTTLPAIRSVGYRQIWEYLEGSVDIKTAREKAIIATRQLAKRQFTWLRRYSDARWFENPTSLKESL